MCNFLASVPHPKLPEVFIVNSDSDISDAVSNMFSFVSSCIASFLTGNFLSVFTITVSLIFKRVVALPLQFFTCHLRITQSLITS